MKQSGKAAYWTECLLSENFSLNHLRHPVLCQRADLNYSRTQKTVELSLSHSNYTWIVMISNW